MRIIALVISLMFSNCMVQAQVKWYMEPTQESQEFITPPTNHHKSNLIIVKFDDRTSKVVDNSGKTIIERDTFIWFDNFNILNHIFSTRKNNGNYKFYNGDFKVITEGDFEGYEVSYRKSYYNTIHTLKNGLLGLIDHDGNVLIKNKFKLLRRISTGIFFGVTEDGKEETIKIKDILNPRLNLDCKHHNKTINVSYELDQQSICITDNNADTILNYGVYSAPSALTCPKIILDSFFIVHSIEDEKLGLIDLDGNLVTNTLYDAIHEIESKPHLLNVKMNSTSAILDLRTKTLSTYGYDFASMTKSSIHIKKGKLIGKLDFDGNVILPPLYKNIIQNDKSFLVDRNDTLLIYSPTKDAFSSDQFTSHKYSLGNSWIVGKDKKYCLYDGKNLELITDLKYNEIKKIRNYLECRFLTRDTTYYDPPKELKNAKGEVIKTYSFSTRKRSNHEYFDRTGNLVYGPIKGQLKIVNETYSYHYLPNDTVAIVNMKNFQPHYLPSKGVRLSKEIITIDTVSYILDHYLDPTIKAVPYRSLIYNDESKIFTYTEARKFGFVSKEEVLTSPIYEEVEHRSDNMYIVKYKGKYGLLLAGENDMWHDY